MHIYCMYTKRLLKYLNEFFNLKFKTDILIRYFYQYAWNPYLHKLLRVHHKMDFLSFVIRHYIFKLWILIKHLQLIKARHMIHMRCTCSTLLCFKMIVLLNYSGFLNMVKKLLSQIYFRCTELIEYMYLQIWWNNLHHTHFHSLHVPVLTTFSKSGFDNCINSCSFLLFTHTDGSL